jgi:SAM-dependent methyltransferase
MTVSKAGGDPYAPLAPIYDVWQAQLGPFWELVLPRLEAELIRGGMSEPEASFLDLGCGTGSLLLGLRARHPRWRLWGLDASAAMLEQARRKPGAATVTWDCGPFERAPELGPVSAAGCFYDGLNHLPDPEALKRALAAVARALAPGGLFVFDLNNRDGYLAWWQGRQTYSGPDWQVTVETSFDPATGRAFGRAQVLRPGSDQPRTETEIVERCYSPDEVETALGAVGLTLERAEKWAFAPGVIAGKTWYVARRTESGS